MSGPYATITCEDEQFVELVRDLAEHGVKFEASYGSNGVTSFWSIHVKIADIG